MKTLRLFFLGMFTLFATTAYSQVVTDYTFGQPSGSYTEITVGTLVAQATVGGSGVTSLDDNVYTIADGTIPFTFDFNGTGYTGLKITTNGYVTFGSFSPTAYGPISSTEAYNGCISAIGRDLQGRVTLDTLGEIRYEVRGSSPSQQFVIQWKNFRRYATSGENYNFQIILNENGVIDLVYGPMTVNYTSSTHPQVGLRGATNTDYLNRTGTTDWSATSAGGTNSATVTLTTTVYPASGLTFEYSPPVGAANDIKALALVLPTSGGSVQQNTAFSPQATFKNNGSATQTGFKVRYQILNAGLSVVYNDSTTIASLVAGATTTPTFASVVGGLAAGSYTIRAVASLAGDANTLNDTLSGPVTSLLVVSSFPYTEDFEGAEPTSPVVTPKRGSVTIISPFDALALPANKREQLIAEGYELTKDGGLIFAETSASGSGYAPEDAMTGGLGWTTGIKTGSVNDWVRGTPTKTQIATAHGGSGKCYVTTLSGNYSSSHNAYVQTPILNFSGLATDPTLDFWHNFQGEDATSGWDAGSVEYSTDAGATWLRVDSTVGIVAPPDSNYTTANSFNWYNSASTTNSGATGTTPPKFSHILGVSTGSTGYTGHDAGWIHSTSVLVGLAGKSDVRIRWRWATDGSDEAEGWALDDVSILPAAADDVKPLTFDEPTNGGAVPENTVFSPKATFKNNGSANQASPFNVKFEIYNSVPTQVYTNTQPIASLAAGASQQVTFGAVSPDLSAAGAGLVAGAYTMKAISLLGGDDLVLNDTLEGAFTVTGTLSGIKTVGSGGDYATLKDAFDAINANVVNGNLTLKVISDITETASPVLNPVNYSGGPWTITIVADGPGPNASAPPPFLITSALPVTVDLNGADNVVIDGRPGGVGIIKGLIIENTSTSGIALRLINGANNDTTKYCILKGSNTSTSSGVVVVSTGAVASANSNNSVEDCDITAGPTKPANGVYVTSSTTPVNTNNVIQRSNITHFGSYGAYLAGGSGTVITQCDMHTDSATSSVYGVYIGNAPGTVISRNVVHDLNTTGISPTIEGIYIFGASGISMTFTIVNNFVSLDAATTHQGATIRGIDYFGWAANSADIDFNSVYIGGSLVTGGSTYAINKRDDAATFNMRNNIAMNARSNDTGLGKHYAIAVTDTPAVTLLMDHNLYYTSGTGGVLGIWQAADQANLPAWQLASSRDANSYSSDPQYTSPGNLHITSGASQASNNGITVAGVGIDIDGEVRGGAPDIGADEFIAGSIGVSLNAGWNLISNPVITGSDSVKQLYPTSLFTYAFSFSPSGYAQDFTMENGTGYWGKFPGTTVQAISGGSNTLDTIPVLSGWNLVGSLSSLIDTSQVIDPAGIRSTDWFGYNPPPVLPTGYYTATQIKSGGAYWVKASAAGILILSTAPAPAEKSGIAGENPLATLSSITITDRNGASQKLYFGSDRSAVNTARYAMPPMPPAGAFDARFETADGGAMVQTHASGAAVSIPVVLQSDGPITVSWTIADGAVYELSNAAGGQAKVMQGSGSVAFTTTGKLIVKSTGLDGMPAEYALYQNYPNPFNPSTSIRFALPVQSRVTAEIYNTLGQRVKVLVNDQLPAGYHIVEWNGTGSSDQTLGSGVYFIRLSATGNEGRSFTDVRKLMLLK